MRNLGKKHLFFEGLYRFSLRVIIVFSLLVSVKIVILIDLVNSSTEYSITSSNPGGNS